MSGSFGSFVSSLFYLETLIPLVTIYLVALWGMFSFWVFIDAKRRFQNTFSAVIFFLLVLIFNFPALIFYIIVRPEHLSEGDLHNHNPGLNIPVANFIDADGNLELSLNIKLGSAVSAESVKVNIEGAKVQTIVKEEVKVAESLAIRSDSVVAKNGFHNKIKDKALKLKEGASKTSKRFLKEFKSYGDKIEKSDEITPNDQEKTSEQQ